MEITSSCKLLDVLDAYPILEAQIVNIAPPFQNLKNPILRRTVGKLATLETVAQIGGMDVNRLVNTLRRAVGQAELVADDVLESQMIVIQAVEGGEPSWISGKPQFFINGVDLLRRGEVPLGKVNELLAQIDADRYILLLTDFEPAPILEAMHKQNRRVFSRAVEGDTTQYLTYIS